MVTKEVDHEEKPCNAFDLDGTLARYDGWKGHYFIGEPIPEIVAMLKEYIKKGEECVIFTARVCCDDPNVKLHTILAIQMWLKKHVGQLLEVTATKHPRFTRIIDDRAVAVQPNTGKVMGRSRSESDVE